MPTIESVLFALSGVSQMHPCAPAETEMARPTYRQGNALVFTVLVATAVIVTAVAGVQITGAVASEQSQKENAVENGYLMDGAINLARADLEANQAKPGDTKTYYVGGEAFTVTFTAGKSALNAVLTVGSTSSKGKALKSTQAVVFLPTRTSSLWSYGIYSDGTYSWLTGSSVTGSVFFRNGITIQGSGGKVSGDFKTSSIFNPNGILVIGGAIFTGMDPLAWPSVATKDYKNAATTTLTGSQTLTSFTFPSANALVIVNGNLTLSNALITGSGTFYVTGNVTVDKALRAKSADHFLVIGNNVTFANSLRSVSADGYYFACHTMTISSPLTLNGAIVASSFLVLGSVNVTWDPWLTSDPANGTSLWIPGSLSTKSSDD